MAPGFFPLDSSGASPSGPAPWVRLIFKLGRLTRVLRKEGPLIMDYVRRRDEGEAEFRQRAGLGSAKAHGASP